MRLGQPAVVAGQHREGRDEDARGDEGAEEDAEADGEPDLRQRRRQG